MRYSMLLVQSGIIHILETYQQGKGTSHEHEERSVGQLIYDFNTNPITGGPATSIDRVQPVEDVTTVTERTSQYCMN